VQRRPDYGRRCHTTRPAAPGTAADPASTVSSKDGLRSLRRLDVPEIGRQHRQHGGDINTTAIPANQSADREGVPQVVVTPTSA
jgi:hypothetical protein